MASSQLPQVPSSSPEEQVTLQNQCVKEQKTKMDDQIKLVQEGIKRLYISLKKPKISIRKRFVKLKGREIKKCEVSPQFKRKFDECEQPIELPTEQPTAKRVKMERRPVRPDGPMNQTVASPPIQHGPPQQNHHVQHGPPQQLQDDHVSAQVSDQVSDHVDVVRASVSLISDNQTGSPNYLDVNDLIIQLKAAGLIP